MRIFLVFCLLNLSGYAQFTPSSRLRFNLDSLTSLPFFDTVNAGVSIYDLTGGKPIYAKHDKMLFRPASNMKVFSSASALHFLGRGHRLITRLYYSGTIEKGKLKGDLIIKAAGDPEFSVKDLDSLVLPVTAAGINKIEGDICADISLFDSTLWGKGWMWDDDPSTDAPFLTPLPVNKNAVKVSVFYDSSSSAVAVRLQPESHYFSVLANVKSGREKLSNINIGRDVNGRTNTIYVTGYLNSRDTVSKDINVACPTLYTLELFKEKLQSAGIYITGKTNIKELPTDTVLAGSRSRDLLSVILPLNKNSDNLSAELVMRLAASNSVHKNISAQDGLHYIDSLIRLAGFDPLNYRMVDGSGVSHYNLVSPELLCGLLRYLHYSDKSVADDLRFTFPWAGIDGTLRNRMKSEPLYGNVYAKTGTLSGVSCLSGYLHTKSNRLLAFSIMMQNHVNNFNRCLYYQHQILEICSQYDE